MSLIESLKSEIAVALKSKDAQKAETIRGLVASVHNEEIAKRSKTGNGALSDEEVVLVLQREAKKRKEAAEIYEKAGRGDLEDKERNELIIIESYLPPALSEEELNAIVKNAISGGETNFGKVMGMVMKEVAGRADSRVVTEVVKKNLGGGE